MSLISLFDKFDDIDFSLARLSSLSSADGVEGSAIAIKSPPLSVSDLLASEVNSVDFVPVSSNLDVDTFFRQPLVNTKAVRKITVRTTENLFNIIDEYLLYVHRVKTACYPPTLPLPRKGGGKLSDYTSTGVSAGGASLF